jgi:hypothetical protein
MKIALLEFHQLPSDPPKHYITASKAQRLLNELRVAIQHGPTLIQLTVKHAYSVVKFWLVQTKEQRELALRREQQAQDYARQIQARTNYPNGAEFNFAQWPAKDQRTQFGL